MRQVRYRAMKTGWGQRCSQAESQMRNFISDRAPVPVNTWSPPLIEVFHFLTDRRTNWQIYDTLAGHQSPLRTTASFFFYHPSASSTNTMMLSCKGRFLAGATKAMRQLYGAGGDRNESICPICQRLPAVVGASCLAAELSGLRCLASFSLLRFAPKGLTTALFCLLPVCHRSSQHPLSTLDFQLPQAKNKNKHLKAFAWCCQSGHFQCVPSLPDKS